MDKYYDNAGVNGGLGVCVWVCVGVCVWVGECVCVLSLIHIY